MMNEDGYKTCPFCGGFSNLQHLDFTILDSEFTSEAYICDLCSEVFLDTYQLEKIVRTYVGLQDAIQKRQTEKIPFFPKAKSSKRIRIEDIKGFETSKKK